MTTHEEIYRNEAQAYEDMISRQPNLSEEVRAIRDFAGLDVLDMGAGTGRLSGFLAREARTLVCTDASQGMLDVLDAKLTAAGLPRNWTTLVADHRKLPLPDGSVDLIVSGWSVCYVTNADEPEWRRNLADILAETKRVLRPGGTIVLFETMGTGTETPNPPESLIPYYEALEKEYAFRYRWIRSDYSFGNADEAARRTAFFFGEALAKKVEANGWATVPECAGIWWRQLP